MESPRSPSPSCSRSSLPKGCGNPAAEDGDSRDSVEKLTEVEQDADDESLALTCSDSAVDAEESLPSQLKNL